MAITREDVAFGYRMILGREPESTKVVNDKMRHRDVDEFRHGLLHSDEFINNNISKNQRLCSFLELRPPLDIQTHLNDKDLDALWNRTQFTWHRLGLKNPHYSVLTMDDFLKNNFKNNEQNFWDSGKYDINIINDVCNSLNLKIGDFENCFELGCGVGRVSFELARIFRKVLSVDISESHLSLAEERADNIKISNVEFKHINRNFFNNAPNFDFFYSRIVLQHSPPPIIHFILTKLLSRLNVGGVAIFQVPVYMKGYRWNLKEYLNSPEGIMEMHCIPQSSVLEIIENLGLSIKEIREDCAVGDFGNCISNTFAISKPLRV